MFSKVKSLKNKLLGRTGGYQFSEDGGHSNESEEEMDVPSAPRSPLSRDLAGGMRQLLVDLGIVNVRKAGQGFFGTVFFGTVEQKEKGALAKWIKVEKSILDEIENASDGRVAVKIFPMIKDKYILDSFWQEVDQLRELKHPNIIRHYAHIQMLGQRKGKDPQGRRFKLADEPIVSMPKAIKGFYCVIIMEPLGRSLQDIIGEYEIDLFTNEEIEHLFECIGAALSYIHSMGVIFQDLNGRNIVSSSHLSSRDDLIRHPLKLIDFGCSSRYESFEYDLATKQGEQSLAQWRGEKEFLEQKHPWHGLSNPFTLEAFNFARYVMRNSVPRQRLSFSVNGGDLAKVFAKFSTVKSPGMRKALLMMGCTDDRQRLTTAQGLAVSRED